MAEERSTGVVVRFDDSKGFSFIKPDEGDDDLFVHHSEIQLDGYRSLQEGQKVEYSVAMKTEHMQAVEVTGPNGSALDKPPRRDAFDGGGGGGGRRSGGNGYGYGGGFGGNGAYRGGNGRDGECYNCGRYGHMARDCERQGNASGMGRGGGGGCYSCGGFGQSE